MRPSSSKRREQSPKDLNLLKVREERDLAKETDDFHRLLTPIFPNIYVHQGLTL